MPLTYRYELSITGTLPLTVPYAKSYLKLETDKDDAILQDMVATVVTTSVFQ